MKPIWRIALGVFASGGLLAALPYALPAWAAAVGLDYRGTTTLLLELARERDRSAAFDVRMQGLRQRIEAKLAVTSEVMAGHMPLLEAAARFRALNAAGPDPGPAVLLLPDPFHGAAPVRLPYEEFLCWNVLSYVQAEESRHPGPTAASPRLEAELRARVESGPLVLPQ